MIMAQDERQRLENHLHPAGALNAPLSTAENDIFAIVGDLEVASLGVANLNNAREQADSTKTTNRPSKRRLSDQASAQRSKRSKGLIDHIRDSRPLRTSEPVNDQTDGHPVYAKYKVIPTDEPDSIKPWVLKGNLLDMSLSTLQQEVPFKQGWKGFILRLCSPGLCLENTIERDLDFDFEYAMEKLRGALPRIVEKQKRMMPGKAVRIIFEFEPKVVTMT